MKSTLAGLGLGALVCLPCLLVLGGGGLALSGALTAALSRDPVVMAAGLSVALVGVTLGWRWLARRRACAADCALPAGPKSSPEPAAPPVAVRSRSRPSGHR